MIAAQINFRKNISLI